MSGIPVYTQSPINAASVPSEVTPQTTTAPHQATYPSAPNTAPATTTTTTSSSYPPAQPGASVPAPTSAAQRYAPLQPTPTTTTDDEGPPAPQPGAVPTPRSRNPVPPPPKAGETYHPPEPQTQMPPQMSMPPPTHAFGAQPPASSTSTTHAPSSSYPVPIPSAPERDLEHPPGYHQNVYASELTSDQRRAQETNNSSSGLGLQQMSGRDDGMEGESVWDTAKKWASQAGGKLAETEAVVWRKINKQ